MLHSVCCCSYFVHPCSRRARREVIQSVSRSVQVRRQTITYDTFILFESNVGECCVFMHDIPSSNINPLGSAGRVYVFSSGVMLRCVSPATDLPVGAKYL